MVPLRRTATARLPNVMPRIGGRCPRTSTGGPRTSAAPRLRHLRRRYGLRRRRGAWGRRDGDFFGDGVFEGTLNAWGCTVRTT
ncbi:hypothetical protein AB0K00_44335, partial [Dactylosporangium sp. NPDC049525]|uniref:hypothetical protein n=1 Tax=Dactylosporangium sp. NPDC049525 TaxID=3154730 RepID=UPI00341A6FE9